MHWYYLDAQRQQNQTDEASLRQLLTDGSVKSNTLVWNETMTEWQPISKALPSIAGSGSGTGPGNATNGSAKADASDQRPALTGAAPALPLTGSAAGLRAFAAILAENSGWTRFLGGSLIALGVLLCLTIAGAVIGWLPIWQGRLLLRTARLASEVQGSGSSIGFTEAMESVSTFLKLTAISALVLALLAIGGGAAAFFLTAR